MLCLSAMLRKLVSTKTSVVKYGKSLLGLGELANRLLPQELQGQHQRRERGDVRKQNKTAFETTAEGERHTT